jgi:hypothetical protein
MNFRALNTDFKEVIIIDLLPEEERRKYCVSEGLKSHLADLGIPQFQLSCSNKAGLFQALEWCANRIPTANFVLQFTAHGDKDGIWLNATNEFVPWQEFRNSLRDLNQKMKGNLVVNMLACKGIFGASIQNLDNPSDPFFGIIGPLEDIEFDQAKRVAKMFYEEMRNAKDIPKIVKKINDTEGTEVLWCHSSQLRCQGSGQEL